jgi:hypothetical protein
MRCVMGVFNCLRVLRKNIAPASPRVVLRRHANARVFLAAPLFGMKGIHVIGVSRHEE